MTNPPARQFSLLQRATAADHDLLMTLIEEFCAVDQHVFDPERVSRTLGPILEHDLYGVVYLLLAPEQAAAGEYPVIGYAVLSWGYSLESGGREALIDEIYLRRRGEGIGSAIMEQIFEAMRAEGIVKMFLETETHNDRARRFYARSGFEQDDSIWMSRDI